MGFTHACWRPNNRAGKPHRTKAQEPPRNAYHSGETSVFVKKATTSSRAGAHDRLRRIEGRRNALVKDLRRAFTRSKLTADGYCAIEGLRMVEEAIRSGLKFRAVFFSESAGSKADRLLPQIGSHAETLLLPDELFASAVPSETPQGVAALVKLKTYQLEDVINRSSAGPLLAIAGVQDPGNLGTILRSAEAFGAAGALLGEGTVSQFNSKAVRASAGSVFRLPIARARLDAALDQLRQCGLRLIATSSHKGTPLPEAKLTLPLALFIGSEGAGLPHELLARMDELIAIPHSAQVESLNAGVAASIVLYQASRLELDKCFDV
jgi:TrmH family RNA methyltransferase